jgi:hypothetical protein
MQLPGAQPHREAIALLETLTKRPRSKTFLHPSGLRTDRLTVGPTHDKEATNDEADPAIAEQLTLDWPTTALGRHRRPYTAEAWCASAAPSHIEHSLARNGADKLWRLRPRTSSTRSARSPATRRCSRSRPG